MTANPDTLERLCEQLREFARARDWEQFHTPKDLSMALSAEAAEVLEHFLWIPAEASRRPSTHTKSEIELELADVLLYLVRLADVLDIDLAQAAQRKLRLNEERYPAAKARGRSDKYDKL